MTYVLITGKPPFYGKTKDELYDAIQKDEPNYIMTQFLEVSADCTDFL